MSNTTGHVNSGSGMSQDQPRTVAIVAAELEAATIAASKVKVLTEELRGLLFKKRAPKKEK
jgi:hypothetical protein